MKAVRAKVEVAFPPDCDELLVNTIKQARKTIYAAVYTFTLDDVAEALIAKAKKGVKVRVKVDARQTEKIESMKTIVKALESSDCEVKRVDMPQQTYTVKMHDKFLVVDDKVVVTGSCNWTHYGTNVNAENMVVIESPAIAQRYVDEWREIGAQNNR